MSDEIGAPTPRPRRMRIFKKICVIAIAVTTLVVLAILLSRPRPPAPNVAATYEGGQITSEDLAAHLELLVGKAASSRPWNIRDLRAVTEEMITDEIALRWGKAREAEKEEKISHLMSHVGEEINLEAWHEEMHRGQMGVNESDIAAYYEANRSDFGERSISEARDEIERRLKAQGEDRFVQNFVAGLKNNADIKRNFAVLTVPEPTPIEISESYEKNKASFVIPESAIIDEIRIDMDESEAKSRAAAESIAAKLRSGATAGESIKGFERLAESLDGVGIEKGDGELSKAVFELDVGQTSPVIKDGASFYIARLRSKQDTRRLALEDVHESIRDIVYSEKQAAWFEANKDIPVFSVGGERLLAGEFWLEYRELPASLRERYSGNAGMQSLAEQLIERYLVSRESSSGKVSADGTARMKEARARLLSQLMEKEEIDDKVKVDEKEIAAYYEKNRSRFVIPPKSQVRQIRIAVGDDRKIAEAKAEEAYGRLSPGLFRKGEDFASVAAQFDSDATNGGTRTGEAIWIGEDRDVHQEIGMHEFHKSILAIREGTIGKPFVFNDSLYIVQIIDRTKPRPIPFDETKEFIVEELRQMKHAELAESLSRRLLKENRTMIYDSILKRYVGELAGRPKAGGN